MQRLCQCLLLLCLVAGSLQDVAENLQSAGEGIEKELDSMKKMLGAVTNQLMMQRYFLEERARASGRSGVKSVRLRKTGTKSYHRTSHTSFGAISMHDHSNNIRTVGLGEFSAVLNGIEFTTRHNDYRLNMPHRTNMTYGMVEPIPFPEVPPSVAGESNVTLAIAEMQEFFRAWRDQNKTHRDYTDYFKPVLCYLEGTWTNSGEDIDEPFFSDRHFIDAKTWTELQKKTRFVAYSGSKSKLENIAFLPTTVMNVINDTIPEFAQFNYRILCHPLKKEVPLDRFKVIDDLHLRLKSKRNIFHHMRTRMARFELSPTDGPYEDMTYFRGFLDELMEEIPGKNNYPGSFTDEGLDTQALEMDGETPKDVSRYHRIYKIGGKDATGISTVNRGYNDDFMFSAMTNQSKVAGMTVTKKCYREKDPVTGKWKKICPTLTQKWSWAIPLEIVYLTPLQKWNPYNLVYKGEAKSDEGKTVFADGRNGGCTDSTAYNGTNSKSYYQTPTKFFGSSHTSSSADTVRNSVCVLDKDGNVRKVQASGIRSFLPRIGTVGSLRIRYPIYPVHEEGSTIWKELDALRELVMDREAYSKYFWKPSDEDESEDLYYGIGISSGTSEKHTHTFELTHDELTSLKHGAEIEKQTSHEAGHEHTLLLAYSDSSNKIYAAKCDGRNRCRDGHGKYSITKIDLSET